METNILCWRERVREIFQTGRMWDDSLIFLPQTSVTRDWQVVRRRLSVVKLMFHHRHTEPIQANIVGTEARRHHNSDNFVPYVYSFTEIHPSNLGKQWGFTGHPCLRMVNKMSNVLQPHHWIHSPRQHIIHFQGLSFALQIPWDVLSLSAGLF